MTEHLVSVEVLRNQEGVQRKPIRAVPGGMTEALGEHACGMGGKMNKGTSLQDTGHK